MTASDRKALKNAAMADIRIVESILRLWDPIGVEPGKFGPADEYDSYAPHIVSMVNGGCKPQALASHLEQLAVVTMGIGSGSALDRARSLQFAEHIINQLQRNLESTERPHEESRRL
jgi:hypothetical protein